MIFFNRVDSKSLLVAHECKYYGLWFVLEKGKKEQYVMRLVTSAIFTETWLRTTEGFLYIADP